jgi:hypothetical protein
VLEILAKATSQEKEIRCFQTRREKEQIPVCTCCDHTHRKPKRLLKSLELIKKFSKVTEFENQHMKIRLVSMHQEKTMRKKN